MKIFICPVLILEKRETSRHGLGRMERIYMFKKRPFCSGVIPTSLYGFSTPTTGAISTVAWPLASSYSWLTMRTPTR